MTLALLAWWAAAAVAGSLALLALAWWHRRGEDPEEHDHWTCHACGTANYGDDCTRCGGAAPWGGPP